MSTDRQALIETFLDKAGWRGAKRWRLAGDASFRKYDRVEKNGRRAVVMDAPPPQEDVRPFVSIARHLHTRGFSVPEILAEDPETGLLLLEVDTDKLTHDLRFEPPFEGATGDVAQWKFPHLYGVMNLDAVIAVYPFEPNADGNFSLPEAVAV